MLLADWGQLIGVIVFLVLAGLRMMSEMGNKEKKAPAKRNPQPRPNPQAGRPRAGEVDLRSEVDEFLRRAKGEPPPEPEPEPAPRLELVEEDRPWTNTVQLEPAAPQPGKDQNASVSDHVAMHVQHLKESQLAENAARLGSEVALADDKVKARLEAKFEHNLGKIARSEEIPSQGQRESPVSSFSADQITAMLSSPEGMRNAVILNEILQRPADRW